MKSRLILLLVLLMFVLSAVALAGHGVIGSVIVHCDCTPKNHVYICYDDDSGLPLPDCQ